MARERRRGGTQAEVRSLCSGQAGARLVADLAARRAALRLVLARGGRLSQRSGHGGCAAWLGGGMHAGRTRFLPARPGKGRGGRWSGRRGGESDGEDGRGRRLTLLLLGLLLGGVKNDTVPRPSKQRAGGGAPVKGEEGRWLLRRRRRRRLLFPLLVHQVLQVCDPRDAERERVPHGVELFVLRVRGEHLLDLPEVVSKV
mmetsp:Transcript_24467/g.76960  ORF Transcript_24467/g.76960 Transcript_24467/m.76960 type:complete len:200 (-) Transcript_24467:397-996(-)